MQKETFRALESSQEGDKNWILSDSIKWEGKHLFLQDKEGTWKKCFPETRSVSLPHMKDKNGTRIFASVNKQRCGGDILRRMDTMVCKAVYSEKNSAFMLVGDENLWLDEKTCRLFEVKGISKIPGHLEHPWPPTEKKHLNTSKHKTKHQNKVKS